MSRYIWRRGKRYYHYGSYNSWDEAYKMAKYLKKKDKKNQYFIEKVETFMMAQFKYKLYTTRFFNIGLFG